MRYIDAPDLKILSDNISRLSCNGLIITTRIELYGFRVSQATSSDQDKDAEFQIQLARSYGSSVESQSPFGSLNSSITSAFTEENLASPATRQVYLQIIRALSQAYPQFDFTLIQPSRFFWVPYSVCQTVIDSTLISTLSDYSTIRPSLWLALTDIAPADVSSVYTVDPSPYYPFEDTDGVWSHNFIFYSADRSTILLFIIKASPTECCEENMGDVSFGCDFDEPYDGEDFDSFQHDISQSEADDFFTKAKIFTL